MGKTTIASAAFVACLCVPAAAQQDARELGYIVGTADVCGHEFDAARVARVVVDTLSKLGPESRNTYELATTGRKYRMRQMGDVERATACAIQLENARRYGLVD
jgi:hypothetical protein